MPYSDADLLALTPEPATLTVTATQNDINGVQGTVSDEATLQPPPLVLVHGIWDSAATWGNATASGTFIQFMRQSRYPTSGIFAADYSASNYLTFEDSSTQITLGATIANALANANGQGIVARKVDVVAHSMGGLVTLYFINQGFTPAPLLPLPANPVHKLVTIGTPEQGTPLALALWNNMGTALPPSVWQNEPELRQYCNSANPGGACSLGEVFAAMGRPVTSNVPNIESAVQSLIPGNQPTGLDSYYAVVGEANPGSCTELLLNLSIGDFIPGESDFSYLGPGSDTIVPQNSQSFGAPSNEVVPISGVVHVSLCGALDAGETVSAGVWNQTLYWLLGGSGVAP